MGIQLPSVVDTLLQSPTAPTSTGSGIVLPPPSTNRSQYTSSYNSPNFQRAVPVPSGITDALTPTIKLPSAYQPILKNTVSDVISSTIISSRTTPSGADVPPGMTDVSSPMYQGSVATRMFSGINGIVNSTGPTFGVDTKNAGPLTNAMAIMANSAIAVGKNSIIQKYGTAILTAKQYSVFADAVVGSFKQKFDDSPLSTKKADDVIKQASNNKILLPFNNNTAGFMGPQMRPEFLGTGEPPTSGPSAYLSGTTGIKLPAPSANTLDSVQEDDYTDFGDNRYYKVYLVSALNASDSFVFQTQPTIQVTEEAAYSTYSPLHAPGEILSFKNSPARTFSIGDVKLISRTPYEAQSNLMYLNLLRSWTKPYFGKAQVPVTSKVDTQTTPSSAIDVNQQASARLKRQGATSDTADKVAAASETSSLLRRHPDTYVNNPPAVTSADGLGLSRIAMDPQNQTLMPADMKLANVAAATSRSRIDAQMKAGAPPDTPVTSKLGSGAGSASFAAHDPRRTDLAAGTAGYGRGSQGVANTSAGGSGRGGQGGPTAAEFNAAQIAPTIVTADTAQDENNNVTNSLGSPPEVLYLYGYSDPGNAEMAQAQNLRRIPVVITSVSFTYPNDVDYIPTIEGVPFPIVMTITISLKETKSPYEIEQFSLADFRAGKLIGW
jgi:hypothetical protein